MNEVEYIPVDAPEITALVAARPVNADERIAYLAQYRAAEAVGVLARLSELIQLRGESHNGVTTWRIPPRSELTESANNSEVAIEANYDRRNAALCVRIGAECVLNDASMTELVFRVGRAAKWIAAMYAEDARLTLEAEHQVRLARRKAEADTRASLNADV